MSELLKQYKAIKEKYMDAILLFRVGDFYESFDEDAKTVSRCAGIILNDAKRRHAIQYCASLPANTLDTVLRKLVNAGYRVAICEQLEDPKSTKGLARRGVTGLLKPS
ncbi:MAG: hypothetical protein EOO10_02690 [Chitinophagaceae bacterium]|nr:MAG: hypothetical protein EOO10_02690 [Chitinophagaceae bacterium]